MDDIIKTSPDGSVQIIFEIPYEDISYKDSLFFTGDVYSSLTQDDIDSLKQDRYNNWVISITPVD